MSDPTWGIYIPGYSYPSAAQQRKFERMYPGAADRYRQERAERDAKEKKTRRIKIEKEREAQANCAHLFVYTNLEDYYICRHCRMTLDSHPSKNSRVNGHNWTLL